MYLFSNCNGPIMIYSKPEDALKAFAETEYVNIDMSDSSKRRWLRNIRGLSFGCSLYSYHEAKLVAEIKKINKYEFL